jgi:eukaryotic-like serine/threonine-protein kinase
MAVPPRVLDALRGRYEIERDVGHGGMATVYLARDVRDESAVAIKVMHPRVANALNAQRFLREIAIAGSMAHPLIVPLRDSGAVDEVLYYVMPYVEGETLKQRLDRVRRLSLEEAVAIAHDLAEALGHAHRQGILHRDVKPENVLLAGDRALVADFGLARAIGPANYQKLTDTGVLVGTVYYMSPEQIRDDRDLDQRTDIYGLGCIVYEMVTGEPPYSGRGLTEVAARILQAPVPSVRQLVPTLPAGLDAAIGRALAKRAGDRFGSMAEFAAALPPRAPPA